jgi:hypothetical protein
MTFQAEQLADDLRKLVDGPGPLSTIDAHRACHEGRLVRRRRRTVRAVAGAAGVSVLVAAVLTWPALLARNASLITEQQLGGAVATGTDPLTSPGVFGWLPADAPNVSYSLHSGQLAMVAKGAERNPSDYPPVIWLSLYDGMPDAGSLGVGGAQQHLTAPRINGRVAFWVSSSTSDPTNHGDTHLVWQVRSGLWADLHGYYLGHDPIEATMLHIARQTRVGEAPVALPISIRGLPRSAVATEADLWRPSPGSGSGWDLDLEFRVGQSQLSIGVTLAGHGPPARVTPTPVPTGASPPNTPRSCVYGKNGLDICVSITGPVPAALGSGGLPGLLAAITSLGPDPKNWTTNVISH